MPNKLRNDNSIIEFVKKYKDIFACAGILFFAFFVLRSAFYGTSSPDESFYLTIPYRIIKGDLFLIDEWHASQFSAFLLYLPMKLYLLINGNTDGIILYFRCLFVLCQTLVSYFTFFKLKKYGTLPAFLSSVVFLLYVTETVNMLDYYTMSLMGFQVTALTLFCSDKLTSPKLIFTGIVFACVVVAQPFNCIIYFIYTLATIIFSVVKKNKKSVTEYCENYFSLRCWGFITAGIAAVAGVFFAFILSRMSLSDFFGNFGTIFGGHDHTLPFADTGKTDMFSYFTIIKTLIRIAPVGFYISVILAVLLIYDRKNTQRRNLRLFISLIAMVILVAESAVISSTDIIATLFRPYILFVLTFVSLILTQKKDKNLILIAFSGIAYIIFLGVISQALDYVGVIGLVISNTALAPSLKQLFEEISSKRNNNESKKSSFNTITKIFCGVCALVFVFDIASGTAIKLTDDTMAVGVEGQTVKAEATLDKGPLKGIRVSGKTAETYYNIIDDTEEIKNNSCEKVLVASLTPWIYFCFDDSPATFTTWYIEEEFDLYNEYYIDKDRIPQCIYVLNQNYYYGFNYADNAESHKAFFENMFNTKEAEGKAGYILYAE